MNWRFWIKNQKESETANLHSGIAEVGEQVSKLTRLQYKTGQDVQTKLERLGANMESILAWQSSCGEAERRISGLEQRQQLAAEALIGWLDDLDYVLAELQNHEDKAWIQLLARWTKQLQTVLASLGVYEMDLLRQSFDPRYAESIKAVAREAVASSEKEAEPARPYVAYEIVEVVKRGFLLSDGNLLRKAQVITLKEEEDHV